jgi:hypothetical protein
MAKSPVESKPKKYYTLSESAWDSYESKCLRNNSPFIIGFVRQKNKQPDKFMVYPVKRELNKKLHITYYLAEHTLKDIESMGGYSRYNMESKPLYELELVKKSNDIHYAEYKPKPATRKTITRKIKQDKTPVTRILL